MLQQMTNVRAYTRYTTRAVKRITGTRFQRLYEFEDLQNFQDLAFKNIGVRFPIQFLRNSRTIAVINKFGNISGGFVLAKYQDSRVVASLPDDALENLKSQFPKYKDDIFEITGLWLSRNERSKVTNVRFWTKLYAEVVKMNKPHFIYAYSSSKPKLGEIYAISKPKRIFKGFTKIMPGMTEPDDEVIEVGSVKACHLAWITQTSFIYKRLCSRRSANKRKMYNCTSQQA